MGEKKDIQSEQYSFPYHHIPQVESKRLLLSRHWAYGSSYAAACLIIEEQLARLSDAAAASRRHLDIGCGDGALLKYLSQSEKLPETEFFGVDFDARAVAWAGMLTGAECSTKDIEDFPPEHFDSISLIEVYEHIPPEEAKGVLEKIVSRLKPGRPLIMTVPSTERPVHPKHYRHFDKQTLEGELAGYFDNIDVAGFENMNAVSKLYRKIFHRPGFVLDWHRMNRYIVGQMSGLRADGRGGRLFAIASRPS